MEHKLVIIVERGSVTGIWTDSRQTFEVEILDFDNMKADEYTDADCTREFLRATDQMRMLY